VLLSGEYVNVTVRYLAQLRQLAGRSTEQIELPGSSAVADLVAVLAELHPALSFALVDGEGVARASVLLFMADEQVSRSRPLADGDEVTLLTPIAGGG
jgi:MoaD family protein